MYIKFINISFLREKYPKTADSLHSAPPNYQQLQQHFRPTVARAFWSLREFPKCINCQLRPRISERSRCSAHLLHALATFATRYLLLASRWMEWRWHVAIAVQQQCQRAHFKIDYWWQKFVLRVKCCKNVLLFSNFECRTTTHSPNDRTIVKCSNIMS